ncbi:L-glutamine synthetase [Acidothermus cellulolyticus 11B]|uniref:Glutamine synthetase n=2 Tax=Acidothermus cellulolyticus TaxID=28049 RepID=A0LTD6_ACIC1|nr:type I glutamate--ammonia ligase [Acidothermus cellulolyticus]ABK52696.1 L-glutamine synthetase [Acidothermus cellulolyticus 11B]MCL6550908.1 type I glutamate--ammonia ligase [Acidothermus cellulolyticus]
MFRNADEVLAFIRDNDVKSVDVRFCDLPGIMQHFTVPAESFDESVFTDGLAFDGSSIRGFQAIHESDMQLLPDPTTAFIDPFRTEKTLAMNFFIHDPLTGEAYSRDPRNVARKAEAYLVSTGIADTAYFGPEAEFYIFDEVRFETSAHQSYYHIDSVAGAWNTGRIEDNGNRGYKVRYKGGYFPVPPTDHFADLRAEMARELIRAGILVEKQHHEVGTAGQAEINYKFNTLLRAADDMQLFKYIVKNVAWRAGKTVTFMPKPIFGDNGSGMHTHQSLWKDGSPLFYDELGYAGLSDTARYYIGGLLRHAPSLLAFTNPTVNSYHRLVPGFEAPVNLVYSQRNRSACIRIPITGTNPKAKRLEFRVPDPSCNPYLAFAAMLMAGLDGIKNKIEPPEPIDKDLYELPPEEHAAVPQVPGSLPEVLAALEADHDYLLEGGVFTPDLIATWLEYKRTKEVDSIRLRPHPHEFELYFDV